MLMQLLINGLLLGATYCLVALGFTLVVGAMDRLNLALGEVAMVSAFVAVALMANPNLPFPLAFIISLATGAGLSILIYFLSFRLVRQGYLTASILSSLGIGTVLTGIIIMVRGTNQQVVPDIVEEGRWELAGITISATQLIVLLLAGLLTVGLYVFLERTVWGTAIRGVSDDAEMSKLLGVPVQRVIMITFALSGALAGAAGLLSGVVYHSIGPRDGFSLTLAALMIIVVGGLGSVKGAVVASLVMAFMETFTVVYLGASYRELGVYVIVAAFLIFRPQGMFGRNVGVLERV